MVGWRREWSIIFASAGNVTVSLAMFMHRLTIESNAEHSGEDRAPVMFTSVSQIKGAELLVPALLFSTGKHLFVSHTSVESLVTFLPQKPQSRLHDATRHVPTRDTSSDLIDFASWTLSPMLSDDSDDLSAFFNLAGRRQLPTRTSLSPVSSSPPRHDKGAGAGVEDVDIINLLDSQEDLSEECDLAEEYSLEALAREARAKKAKDSGVHADAIFGQANVSRTGDTGSSDLLSNTGAPPVSKFFNPGKRKSLCPSHDSEATNSATPPHPRPSETAKHAPSSHSTTSRTSIFSPATRPHRSSSTSLSSGPSSKPRTKRVLAAATDSEPEEDENNVRASATAATTAALVPPIEDPQLNDAGNGDPDGDDDYYEFFGQDAFNDPWGACKFMTAR
jgi:hypothetical protein